MKRVKGMQIREKPGPHLILSSKEEETIVDTIITSANRGFNLRMIDVRLMVQLCLTKLNRKTAFINNLPSTKWFACFLKRHSTKIRASKPRYITNASANVTEISLRNWFSKIEATMRKELVFNILLYHPERIANMDETGIEWNPTANCLVLSPANSNARIKQFGATKTITSMAFTITASGEILKPLLLLPFKKSAPDHVLKNMDHNYFEFACGTGYSKHESFLYYIKYVRQVGTYAEKMIC